MDSTSAACAAAPEWHWFWVWFGLLVLVNVATEIALCTIAATTRHLLVCLTSLGHHNRLPDCPFIVDRMKLHLQFLSLVPPCIFVDSYEPGLSLNLAVGEQKSRL